MGNFRIVIDAVGDHGQDRGKKDGEVVDFGIDKPEAIAQKAVEELKAKGVNVLSAKVFHWPADVDYNVGAEQPYHPVNHNGDPCIADNLVTGIRTGNF